MAGALSKHPELRMAAGNILYPPCEPAAQAPTAKVLPRLPCRNANNEDGRQNRSSLPALRFDDHDWAAAGEKRIAVPTETAIVIAGVVLAFAGPRNNV